MFSCKTWLAKNEGDGAISKEFVPEGEGGITTFKIDVKTGDVKYAGTGANAFITLFGSDSESGECCN